MGAQEHSPSDTTLLMCQMHTHLHIECLHDPLQGECWIVSVSRSPLLGLWSHVQPGSRWLN